MFILGLWSWGKNNSIEVKYLSHHIISRVHTVNMTSLLMLILITQLK